MEKRKAYIIASLAIVTALAGLSFWYLYTTKETATIGEISELELYTDVFQNPVTSSQGAQGTQIDATANEIIQPESNEGEKPESWQLIQIHTDPVAGSMFTEDSIQFIDQKTGNILRSSADNSITKTSSITVTDVREAYLTEDSSVLIMRNNQELPIRITTEDVATSTIEYGLYDTALQLTQVPEQDGDLYYTTPNDGRGVSIRSIKNPSEKIWSSYLKEWLIQATTESLIITQKPSYNIPGYSYIIPQTGGEGYTSPLAQDLPGLIMNVSPDDSKVLYSTSGTRGLELFLKDIISGNITPLSVSTLASKCAWSSDSITLYCALPSDLPQNLPDSWYKGQVYFTDDLWRINSETGLAFELAHETNLDIIDLRENNNGTALIFKNKTDQSLWAVIKE